MVGGRVERMENGEGGFLGYGTFSGKILGKWVITGREQGRSKHFKKKYGAGGVTQWKATGLV